MQLQFEQVIALPRDTVWAFHENPTHLVLHQDWSRFRLLAHAGNVQTGNQTWFETTVAGILPVVLGFEHTTYEPPRCFAEQLVHGPFRTFTHRHEFEETNNGTRVRDVLTVELPWYYGGEPMMKTVVGPLLRYAFRQRGAALAKQAQSGQIAPGRK